MLYMKGMSFDAIAKWIGHSNPSITSGIYGRLSHTDVNGMMKGVPFVDEGHDSDIKEQWARVARFVTRPYVFDDAETLGMQRPRPSEASSSSGKRRATELAASEGIHGPSKKLTCGPRVDQNDVISCDSGLLPDALEALVKKLVNKELTQQRQATEG